MDSWQALAAVAVSVGVITTFLVQLGKLIYWVGTVDEHRKSVDEHRSAVGKFMEGTRSQIEGIRSQIEGIRSQVTEIRSQIKDIFHRLPPPAVARNSPLQLTDFGREMSAFLDAESWASDLASSLRDEVAGKRPFEVDDFSNAYVHERLTAAMMEQVAACAYEFGVERHDVCKVLRVVLRDALLRQGSTAPKPRP